MSEQVNKTSVASRASESFKCQEWLAQRCGWCAGAVEAVFAVMSLVHNTAPPTLNLEDPLPGPWAGSLVRGGPLLLPPGPKQVLSNSFGFGGVNASLLFGSPPILLDPVVDGTP